LELRITGQNLEVGAETRSYVERKLVKFDRQLPRITGCDVELTREKARSPGQRYVAQVTLDVKGTLLRAEERAADLRQAVDGVVDVLARQIERYKGKRYQKNRGNSFARGTSSGETESASEAGNVVRVKRFPVHPMTVDDAIEQMELLGHSFFLFLNSETDGISLLYRRRDGNYSVIEPEEGGTNEAGE
jgi:putative sigma-54 modulation protein